MEYTYSKLEGQAPIGPGTSFQTKQFLPLFAFPSGKIIKTKERSLFRNERLASLRLLLPRKFTFSYCSAEVTKDENVTHMNIFVLCLIRTRDGTGQTHEICNLTVMITEK